MNPSTLRVTGNVVSDLRFYGGAVLTRELLAPAAATAATAAQRKCQRESRCDEERVTNRYPPFPGHRLVLG